MIYTWSQFNYGHSIADETQTIVFSEGSGPQLVGYIPVGSYTLSELADKFAETLSTYGTLTYTASVNRMNNRITISAPTAFSLILSSSLATAFGTLGFSGLSTLSGQASYTAVSRSGKTFRPQFMLQSYVPSANFSESLDQTVNRAASGRVELIRFGVTRKIEMELKFITNLPMDNVIIRDNPTGVSDALDFLDFITTKSRFEFVPDQLMPMNFQKVILDRTATAQDGTGYKLKELYEEISPDIYESGLLTMQVVE